MELWSFELRLKARARSVLEIDWDSHLPADDVTAWLTVDLANKHLILKPAQAIPDPP